MFADHLYFRSQMHFFSGFLEYKNSEPLLIDHLFQVFLEIHTFTVFTNIQVSPKRFFLVVSAEYDIA